MASRQITPEVAARRRLLEMRVLTVVRANGRTRLSKVLELLGLPNTRGNILAVRGALYRLQQRRLASCASTSNYGGRTAFWTVKCPPLLEEELVQAMATHAEEK